jgi:hypothetical protein
MKLYGNGYRLSQQVVLQSEQNLPGVCAHGVPESSSLYILFLAAQLYPSNGMQNVGANRPSTVLRTSFGDQLGGIDKIGVADIAIAGGSLLY